MPFYFIFRDKKYEDIWLDKIENLQKERDHVCWQLHQMKEKLQSENESLKEKAVEDQKRLIIKHEIEISHLREM